MTQQNAEAEKAFRLLSAKIDEVGEANTSRFLAKLALILAHELSDHARFEDAVARAMRKQDDGTERGGMPAAASMEGAR